MGGHKKNEQHIVELRSHFLVGNKRAVKFWERVVSDQNLEEAFPDSLSFLANRDGMDGKGLEEVG